MILSKELSTLFLVSTSLTSALFLPFKALSNGSRFIPLSDVPGGARQEHSTVYLEPDTIALIGGIVPDASAAVAPFSSTDRIEFYSITNGTWRTAAPLPKRVNHPNSAAVDGKIYVLGAMDDGDKARDYFRVMDDSWVYDPTTDAWASVAPFPSPRGASAVAVHKDKIYVIAGYTELFLAAQVPLLDAISDLVSVYDTTTRKWVTDALPDSAKHIPGPRDHARAEVVDDKLYVIGGFSYGGYNQSDTVFILDLQNLDAGWVTSPAKMPTPRASFGIGVQGRQIYTIGGEGNATADAIIPLKVFDQVEVYDTVADVWTQREPITYERQGMGVGVNGKLYLPGGADRQPVGPVARFDAYIMQ